METKEIIKKEHNIDNALDLIETRSIGDRTYK